MINDGYNAASDDSVAALTNIDSFAALTNVVPLVLGIPVGDMVVRLDGFEFIRVRTNVRADAVRGDQRENQGQHCHELDHRQYLKCSCRWKVNSQR